MPRLISGPVLAQRQPVRRRVLVPLLSLCLCAFGVRAVFAQSSTPPPSSQQASDPDDDRTIHPAEPDFRLVNLPTTMRLPLHGMNFGLTHRFNGNLRNGGFGHQAANLFGLDEGANVGFDFRFGILPHVEAGVFRTNVDKDIQFYGKWDAVHQHAGTPLSISALFSVEGSNNFRIRREPGIAVVISRSIADRVALYATPAWVHNTAAEIGEQQDTTFVGLGARILLGHRTYVVGEVSPRLSGYTPGDAEYGFGIEKRVGGHVFQLNFTNTPSTTLGQVARGGFPNTLYLGFNLARKFY